MICVAHLVLEPGQAALLLPSAEVAVAPVLYTCVDELLLLLFKTLLFHETE